MKGDTLTDLEIVRACARAMGYKLFDDGRPPYDPLTNKAQALDLVIELRLFVKPWPLRGCDGWIVGDENEIAEGRGETLLRAICECSARVQLAKEGK